jgi:hypothetical protein
MQLDPLQTPPRSINLATPDFLVMNGTVRGGRSQEAAQGIEELGARKQGHAPLLDGAAATKQGDGCTACCGPITLQLRCGPEPVFAGGSRLGAAPPFQRTALQVMGQNKPCGNPVKHDGSALSRAEKTASPNASWTAPLIGLPLPSVAGRKRLTVCCDARYCALAPAAADTLLTVPARLQALSLERPHRR